MPIWTYQTNIWKTVNNQNLFCADAVSKKNFHGGITF